jgi:L-amino acid N-acyltransferase YncA
MKIRRAEAGDAEAILRIVMPVIGEGRAYALDRDMSEAEALAYWTSAEKETFVVVDDRNEVVGTYYMRANQAGGGRHVCNCGYVTSQAAQGRGIARRMGEHSLTHARERGFRAMQFNFVVARNDRAVKLWSSLGFRIAGRLPGAFQLPEGDYVDALVMYLEL